MKDYLRNISLCVLAGHSVPLVCSQGFALLSVLQSCQLYTAIISLLQHLVPLFLQCPRTLIESDKLVNKTCSFRVSLVRNTSLGKQGKVRLFPLLTVKTQWNLEITRGFIRKSFTNGKRRRKGAADKSLNHVQFLKGKINWELPVHKEVKSSKT